MVSVKEGGVALEVRVKSHSNTIRLFGPNAFAGIVSFTKFVVDEELDKSDTPVTVQICCVALAVFVVVGISHKG